MATDFYRLLRQVADCEITDTDRVREIIADARTAVEARREAIREMECLLLEAEESFFRKRPLVTEPPR